MSTSQPKPISVPRVYDVTGDFAADRAREIKDWNLAEKQLREGSKRTWLPREEWMRRVRKTRSF